MRCPYCGEDKPADNFTDEHVLPKGLGGALQPTNPFKLRVCGACNGYCGRHVDGPVVRYWLMQLAQSNATIAPAFLPGGPPAEMAFFGPVVNWEDPETVCDMWLGPTQDQVFHFHRPYPEGTLMAGGAPWARRTDLDAGLVLVGLHATNPAWHPVIARCLKAQFGGAEIHLVNDLSQPVPPEYERHAAWILSLPRNRHTRASIRVSAGERFTAKLGLGLGALHLGSKFEASEDANALRKYLHERSPAARRAIGLKGRTLLDLTPQASNPAMQFAWRDCHTLVLLPTDDALTLLGVFYGQYPFLLRLTTDRSAWEERVPPLGKAWVVAPGLRSWITDTAVELAADILETNDQGALAGLAHRLDAIPSVPPAQLPPT